MVVISDPLQYAVFILTALATLCPCFSKSWIISSALFLPNRSSSQFERADLNAMKPFSVNFGRSVYANERIVSLSSRTSSDASEAIDAGIDLNMISLDDSKSKTNLPNYLVLATIPILFGSYTPVVKYMFDTSTVPPPPLVFNFLSYFVAFAIFQLVESRKNVFKRKHLIEEEERIGEVSKLNENTPRISLLLRGGVELGLWLFFGSLLLAIGITGTTATRAAILVQLTTIIVPVLDSFFTRSPPAPSIIIACFLAASGAVLVSIDSSIADAFITIRTTIEHCVGLAPITAVGAGASFAFGKSEMMVILSACFYSMHIIRLGAFANRISSAAALARIKSLTQLLTAIAAITFTVLFNVAERRTLLDYIISVTSAPSLNRDVLLLLSSAVWNGAICTAFTMWAQTFAQRVVSSTRANLVYSTQPVWACIMSVVFLGERLHSAAMVGSVLLLVAVIISGRSSAPFRQ